MGVCLGKIGGGHPARIWSSRAHGLAHGADFRRRFGAACGLHAAGGRRSRHAVLFYRRLVHGWSERPGPQTPRHYGQKIRAQERDQVRRNAEGSAATRGVDQHAKSDPVQQRRAGCTGTGLDRRVPGHPTPMGVFSVIEKDRYHHSNIYSGAPMPYMQRITWSGVALHEGVLPGHPDSHGCIRLTHGFAAALWPTTHLGVRVIVSRNELTPTNFEHPKLFEPKPKPSVPDMASTEELKARLLQFAESSQIATDARAVDATASEEPAKPAATDVDPPKPPAPTGKSSAQPVKHAGQVAVFVSRKEHKLFVRQGFVPLFDTPVTIDEGDRPLGTHVFTALGPKADGSGMRWNLITVVSSGPQKEVEKPRGRHKRGEPAKPVVVETKTASTAAEALDRIELPKEAVDRISELLTPGSSLIVSDLGNSYETGQGTEFVVLAH